MLLRHSAYYLLARGLPGLFSFAALAVYTRLLAPDEFGRYALLIAGVGFVNVIVFQWLRLVAARFLQAHVSPVPFLGSILAQFYLLSAVVSMLGLGFALVWPDPVWQRLLALAVPLLITQAGLELSLVVTSARLEPHRYGLMLGSKTVMALIIGALLAWAGLGAAAPVWGLIAGQIVALVLFGRYVWRDAKPRWPKPDEHRRQLGYGMPLVVTFALVWVISGSDRFLLAWLLDEDAVGYYSAGYDLVFQSLTLLLTIINTAAYPLAVKALEKGGTDMACRQLARNGEVIVAVALAGAAGLIVLSPYILALFIGEDFRPGAAAILPIIAVAAALSGIKAYHFDIAFHLGEQSRTLALVSGVAAVINIVLNIMLIPVFGIAGAAWATLGAYAMALVISTVAGRRAFSMPSSSQLFVKGVVVALAAVLGLGLLNILGVEGFWVLPVALFLGGLSVLSAAFLLDLGGARRPLVGLVRKTKLIYKD